MAGIAGELNMDVNAGLDEGVSGEAWGITPDAGVMNELTLTEQIAAAPDALTTKNGLFGNSGLGGTMQGIGAIAGAAANIYDAHNRKKYQDKVFGMEEKRVARETARQDKQQLNYEKVFG